MFEKIRQFLRSLRSDTPEDVCRRLSRPASLSRRSFLRALGVTGTTVAMGGWDRLLQPSGPFNVFAEEPNCGAFSIPFATLPQNLYIRGPRYRVMFASVVTRTGGLARPLSEVSDVRENPAVPAFAAQ